MRWAVVGLSAIVGLTGCRGNPARFDPFLGPATVPPPSTAGATLLPPGDPYAPPVGQPAPGGVGTPFGPTTPAAPAPYPAAPFPQANPYPQPGATPYAPPGGSFQYRQSSYPTPLGPTRNDLVPIGSASASPVTIRRSDVDRRWQPADTSSRPRANPSPDGRTADARSVNGGRESFGIEQASFETPLEDRAAPRGPEATPEDFYRYEPDYARLSGRVDYSAIAKSWRLRYIPLDRDPDAHGGSVLLVDGPALADLRPGEFVEVSGNIDTERPAAEGFAPWYRVASVRAVHEN